MKAESFIGSMEPSSSVAYSSGSPSTSLSAVKTSQSGERCMTTPDELLLDVDEPELLVVELLELELLELLEVELVLELLELPLVLFEPPPPPPPHAARVRAAIKMHIFTRFFLKVTYFGMVIVMSCVCIGHDRTRGGLRF